MWANAQRDGRLAEYRWRPLFNAAKFGWRPLPCSNAAKMPNPLKFAGVPQTNETIIVTVLDELNGSQSLVGRSSPYYGDMWRRYCCLTNFFPIVDRPVCLSCEDIARQSCAIVPRWRFLATFLRPVFAASHVQHISDLHSKFELGPRHV